MSKVLIELSTQSCKHVTSKMHKELGRSARDESDDMYGIDRLPCNVHFM